MASHCSNRIEFEFEYSNRIESEFKYSNQFDSMCYALSNRRYPKYPRTELGCHTSLQNQNQPSQTTPNHKLQTTMASFPSLRQIFAAFRSPAQEADSSRTAFSRSLLFILLFTLISLLASKAIQKSLITSQS
ncbi:hypothetical protein MJO28_016469 [Puccinia striiformis f. sp. tritici]|uniref:Uncharacterized protein n=4 Tax=Puccinia striiformis TaxID=27350 RepID=A0A0L0VZF8_9BASI|nr:hypothetical protein Pst134EA_030419 [Puccinia striiformis f. sp. tritici]KAI9600474.1 hypothetical protein H4Q26_000257 [Puccinia striiformis f. sp. tritici PST-130]KNF04395.1 hypothetical protein PSTG_02312 [Puccinia striiformis f. sp. tritici PST-78]POW12178.1 hypothetical protein PSTT_04774 [Puccinia striiformis]KAH9440337.1 hypothetical protein Pst134EB_030956 [Puccinia striiformis f. sp. tritici]KAH9446502.1 hypothetical protein Pst134EA_030419 [Puccinia striiformis f. sp. tritici]